MFGFSRLRPLVGQTLKSVRVKNDQITFHCENGDYVFHAEGDCCSRTYIEDVSGPTSGKIIAAEEGPYSSEDCGEIKNYCDKLTIEGKGYLDIEYRNESNGYYGGSLEWASGPGIEDYDKYAI